VTHFVATQSASGSSPDCYHSRDDCHRLTGNSRRADEREINTRDLRPCPNCVAESPEQSRTAAECPFCENSTDKLPNHLRRHCEEVNS